MLCMLMLDIWCSPALYDSEALIFDVYQTLWYRYKSCHPSHIGLFFNVLQYTINAGTRRQAASSHVEGSEPKISKPMQFVPWNTR